MLSRQAACLSRDFFIAAATPGRVGAPGDMSRLGVVVCHGLAVRAVHRLDGSMPEGSIRSIDPSI